MQLDQLEIIITGGRGMGGHFARRLAEAGAKVAVGDVDEEALDALPAGIFKRRLDVSDSSDAASFVTWAAEQMGGVNGLVNNAGILRDGLLVKRDRTTGEIKTMSDDNWRKVLAVNLDGPTFMTRAVVGHMLKTQTRPGVIVNISSISRHGNRGQSNYVAAKAALAANTVTWAREFSRYGIRVGAIAPGMVETPMTDGMNDKAREALVKSIPVGRIGQPEDIWLAVEFVLKCEYFNGKTIDVDGGGAMG